MPAFSDAYPSKDDLRQVREWDWRDAAGVLAFARERWWPDANTGWRQQGKLVADPGPRAEHDFLEYALAVTEGVRLMNWKNVLIATLLAIAVLSPAETNPHCTFATLWMCTQTA